LESFSLIEVNSLAKYSDLYKPYSWGIEFGFDREIDDRLRANLKLKGGKSFELFDALLSIEPTIGVGYRDQSRPYIGYNINLLKSFRELKIGAVLDQSYFDNGDDFFKAEAFLTYQFGEDVALNLSLVERRDERVGLGRVFFYF